MPFSSFSGTVDFPINAIQFEYEELIEVDAFKKAEDGNGWILRIHEPLGGTQKVVISIPNEYSWQETNLLEKNEGNKGFGNCIFTLTPFAIKTIRICEEEVF